MTVSELLKQYTNIVDAIFKSFGMNGGYGEINDSTSDFFCINNNTVEWSEEKFYEEGTYSNEIVKKFENDTHYLFYVENGCGERYYQIFDKLKEIKWII